MQCSYEQFETDRGGHPRWMPGREKRSVTNDSELRRMDSCYPLRFDQKSSFKQAFGGGQFGG
jgi:hypothetical protein